MFAETVRLLTWVTPWLALLAGFVVRLAAPTRVRAAGWAIAIAAAVGLLAAALIDGEDARARLEAIIAAPIIGGWQAAWYAVGALLGLAIRRARGETR